MKASLDKQSAFHLDAADWGAVNPYNLINGTSSSVQRRSFPVYQSNIFSLTPSSLGTSYISMAQLSSRPKLMHDPTHLWHLLSFTNASIVPFSPDHVRSIHVRHNGTRRGLFCQRALQTEPASAMYTFLGVLRWRWTRSTQRAFYVMATTSLILAYPHYQRPTAEKPVADTLILHVAYPVTLDRNYQEWMKS